MESADTIRHREKFHKAEADFCVTGSNTSISQVSDISLVPCRGVYHIACDIVWGMGLVTSFI